MVATGYAPCPLHDKPSFLDAPHLTQILEAKLRYDGRRQEFPCRLIEQGDEALIVLHVADRTFHVADLVIPPGTVTFGHFWARRPFNAYHWMSDDGATLGCYFNIADRTTWTPNAVSWRDLIVDVLLRTDGRVDILDRDELPGDFPADLAARIEAATATILDQAEELRSHLEAEAIRLWPRAFGMPRP